MKKHKSWILVGVRPCEILSSFLPAENTFKRSILIIALLQLALFSFSQTIDSTREISHFSSAVSVTNNGISLIPTFSLGKPAAIFNMSVGKRKWSFEPELRFALEGKPWSFIFWWRYKLLTTKKFRVNVGAHPALNFKTETIAVNGDPKDVIVTQRYLAGELSPNYLLSKNLSVGMYYLHGRGMEEDAPRAVHFLTLNSNFSNVKLTEQFFLRFTPQFYYLKLDRQDGFYFTSTLTLAKRNFPLSLQSIINKTIQTNIGGSKNFVWNATLIYFFNKEYVELKQPGL